ncbi:MAG: hypothetical protein MO852_12315 [Candidatus Devosia euplotis]|nr:hypothetical protein [Candidatus Devosia euplotis]
MSKKNDIEAALIALAKPGMSSKQLQKDIAKAFPKASKKRHPPLGLWRNDRHR